MRGAVALLCLLLLALARPARADERAPEATARIVLLLDDAPRDGLTDALKIHVPAGTRVAVAPRPRALSAAGRIGEAHEALSRQPGGVLAMWLDEDRLDGDEREVVVYLVARRRGTALVEVVRVRAGAREELDRAIAVKAREVLDTLAAGPSGLSAALARPEQPTGDGSAAPTSPVELGVLVELDIFGATSAAGVDPQLGAQTALGLALEGRGFMAELAGIARIVAPASVESAAGSIEVDEVALGGAARVLWKARSTSVAVGGFVLCGARVLSATGATPLGATGSADRAVPFVSTGPEVRVALVSWLRMRAAAGPEIPFLRQRFAVNGEPLADLGRARGVVEVGLVATAF